MKNILFGLLLASSCVMASPTATTIDASALQSGKVAIVDISRNRLAEFDMNGKLTWEYKIPWSISTKDLGLGADIEWIPETDSFLFVVPRTGIYEVNRKKEIVWKYETGKVSHDADLLPNGNILFINAWDNDNDPTFTEITRSGKVVEQWTAKQHLNSITDKRNHTAERNYSFSHVNSATRLSDGSTLISLRNFNMFVIVKDGKIIKRSSQIKNVHDPFISGTRTCFAAREPNRLTCVKEENLIFRFIDKDKQWSPMRTVEPLKNGNILITGSYQIGQLSENGELVWKLKFSEFGNQKSGSNFIYKAAWVYK
jgi:hypothetical protein